MKHVFIDSNVLLKVYTYNYDSHDFLEEILDLINKEQIRLILTQQLYNEFYREREKVLSSSLKKVKLCMESNSKLPLLCRDIQKIKSLSKKAYEKLIEDAKKETLKVDKLIKQIFEKAGIIQITTDVISKAKERFDLGNPPGKNRSYGDSINWMILLEEIPEGTDLYFIGVDLDYLSKIDNDEISHFLRKEWESKKKSKIYLYKSILHFLKTECKKEEITEEQIEEEEETPSHGYYNLGPPKWFIPVSESSVPAITSASEILPSTGEWGGSTFGVVSSGENEIKCSYCGRIFYHEPQMFSIGKKCPYCGHTQWS